jgi:hypothetical protein
MGFGNGAIRGTGGTGAGKHTLEGPHVGHTGFVAAVCWLLRDF